MYNMNYRMILFLLVLLMLPLAAASMRVPAVAVGGGEGQMVSLFVEIAPGEGSIYTETSPFVGIDTQESERTAVSVAAELAGKNASEYDVFLSMDDVNGARHVDGPSAGAAITLLLLSELEGKQIRGDVTVTGSIDADGSIGEVGGVPEKIEAAAHEGFKVVMIPSETSTFELLTISSYRESLNISIVTVDNISEASEVAFSNAGEEPWRDWPGQEVIPPPSYPPARYDCTNCSIQKFAATTKIVVNRTDALIYSLNSSEGELYEELLPGLLQSSADANQALEKRYYYTAANTAFLAEISAKMIIARNMTKQELLLEYAGSESCFYELPSVQPTYENIGWYAGAELREAWARDSFEGVKRDVENAESQEEILDAYYELLHARGWCDVASEFYTIAAEVGGTPLNESLLENLAALEINTAEKKNEEWPDYSSGATDHIRTAKFAYDREMYAAAVFDAAYASTEIDSKNFSLINSEDLYNKSTELLENTTAETAWGDLFKAHAEYYHHSSNGSVSIDSVRIMFLSLGLENATKAMRSAAFDPSSIPDSEVNQPIPPQPWKQEEDLTKLNEELMMLSVLLSALLAISSIMNIIVFVRLSGQIGRLKEEVEKACIPQRKSSRPKAKRSRKRR